MKAHYNFTVEYDGTYNHITYKKSPVKYTAAFPIAGLMAIPALILTLLLRPESVNSGAITFLIIMTLLAFGTVFIINSFRGKGSFSVGKNDIIANKKTYELAHVSAIGVLDPAGKYEPDTLIYVEDTGFGTQRVTTRKSSAAAMRKVIAESNYKIAIRYGTKDIIIARQLNEVEADVLWKKVTELADLNKKRSV